MSDSPSVPPEDGGRPQNLGTILRTARERKGLELSDVAEVTHVRKEYLSALEEGRYTDLPEDVYSRNFLRLFAQAVSLESAALLDMYARERSGAHSRTTAVDADGASGAAPRQTPRSGGQVASSPAPRPAPEQRRASESVETPRAPLLGTGAGSRSLALPAIRIGSMMATVLLVVAIVGVALWAFNNRLFNAGRSSMLPSGTLESNEGAVPTPGTTEQIPAPDVQGTPSATEQARDVLVTIDTDPPGAEVTVDGFPLPGTTPIENVPVTARASRLVRVTLDGYAPFESTYDLSFDRTLSVNLAPVPAPTPQTAVATETTSPAGPPPAAGQGQISLAVTEATWLEVYAGTARQQGDRLVYTTAQPGDRFIFDLPVYVHVGNAAGLHVAVNGQDLGAFGSSGAVTGRAFTQ